MSAVRGMWRRGAALAAVLLCAATTLPAQTLPPVQPPDSRGRADAERAGTHDAANIRTIFWNYGMVGDYPADPINVDLSVFHSAEVPKGSGMNYSDGITPFVLAKIRQRSGEDAYIMETGFRERQGTSPYFNRVMRFEPRPGFFQADPRINRGRSPAMSHDPRTWPDTWPDKGNDPDDPGWAGAWNGYFGKRPAADQESFTVMDDQFYDGWDYYADSRDTTRRGLGLRVEVRGFQWANPQAGNVIFWHYDITNESPTDYDDNIIFGLYMDSGVGGSARSCDNIAESDDDNAYFDKSLGLNLVYTWDLRGHGVDLSSNCGRTGYLGYAYLETPGNALDAIDNDNDGITDELRDGGPGTEIVGGPAILAYAAAHYDTAKFRAAYGPIENRPAYRAGVWWTGDEDMDWRAELNDDGADGVPETHDAGEGDGQPSPGEANFDRTDLNESDQIGLTGFKMNRIAPGQGNPDPNSDDIVFFTNAANWPERLFTKFTDPNPAARFDSALAANYNLGFLFASGPFKLKAGKTERFSLALAYGADLTELRETVHTVQLIYNANYQFAIPPAAPIVTAEPGDGRVRLSWTDNSERSLDPVTFTYDFEGYRIYRSTDPDFLDPKVISTGRGNTFPGNGKPLAQFDLADGKRGYTRKTIDGVAYWLGEDTGITHTFTDTTAVNGQQYYYAVCAYDFGYDIGADSSAIYPSENSITVSRTPRGGVILPINVAAARPEPRVPGFVGAGVTPAVRVAGADSGSVVVQIVNSNVVPNGHLFTLGFEAPSPDSIRATSYLLRDSTAGVTLFTTGRDLDGAGVGPVAAGLLPVIQTGADVTIDPATGFAPGSPTPTNGRMKTAYTGKASLNLRRTGYPDDISIVFDDVVRDTGLALGIGFPAKPAKFRVFAHSDTGDIQLDFRFRDIDNNGTVNNVNDRIDILTLVPVTTTRDSQITWSVQIDTVGQGAIGPLVPPRLGDRYDLKLRRPFGPSDVYAFSSSGQTVNGAQARDAFRNTPYVVPNPYVGAASFEPARFAVSGRGERRLEFRAIPQNAVVRIYTVKGELVRTLRQDGSLEGIVPWDLRTKDNLDVAPGLYIFHVDAPDIGTASGKFAILK